MSNAFRHQISLALNFVLMITVGWLAFHRLNHAPATTETKTSQKTAIKDNRENKMPEKMPSFTEEFRLRQYADASTASDRRRLIVDQLREMGVPNDILGLVARVDFEVQWDRRFMECQGNMKKTAAVQLEMNKSKDAEMRVALGEEGFRQWDQKNMLWEAMSTEVDVTPAEGAAVYALKKKLQQSQFDVEQARLDGTMDDAEINAAYDKAYSEYYQQLKSVLGDDRYAKSQQLDDAFAADNLRYQLAKANPSDSQFKELFNAEKEWTRSRSELEHQFQNDLSSQEYTKKLRELDAARDQEYQRVLGSEVYSTLQKQQDPVYSQMKKYENLWGLDDKKIDYVYDTLRNYASSVQNYQAQVHAMEAQGQVMDWDAVNRNLQAIASQTQQGLQNYLGDDSFNRLQRNRVFVFNQPQTFQ